jgi:predicted metal-dependent phosphoesterase TrpH
MHSTHSDGSFTPAEIISMVKAAGLSAVALTDHNTVSGVPAFMAEAARQGVTAVAGTELSTLYWGKEIHILGLFIPESHYADVGALTAEYDAYKDESNRDLIVSLAKGGYTLDYKEMLRKYPDCTINRAHFAQELVARGYVSSVSEAFDRILDEKNGYYVPPKRLGLVEAIRFLRSIGAVTVWAHPLQFLDEATFREILPIAMDAGLLGMEVQHSSYDDGTVLCAKALADEFGLLYSGGSDFHGTVKPDVRLGVGKGNLDIPDSYWKALREASRRIG